jgi:tRNA (guanine-N7-)-methyltransferase
MRKKKNLNERVSACSEVLICKLFHLTGTPGAPNFSNSSPVWLEIGCGKGSFVNQAAQLHPNVSFIAVEKSENVVISAMERTKAAKIPNVRYIIGMAEYLALVIPPNSIERIYLNFSCPFPKERYAKHRLTHENYLKIYKQLLCKNGRIYFKTDNCGFFGFSSESFSANGFLVENITRDLHNSGITGNIITEYEALFTKQGYKINYLEAIVDKSAII